MGQGGGHRPFYCSQWQVKQAVPAGKIHHGRKPHKQNKRVCDPSKGVRVSKVNILDKDGKPAWKEKYTVEEVRAIEEFQGYRSFQREFMNNPITDGAIFKQEWIRFKKLPPLEQYDSLVLYIDPSFKGSSKNDYKACKLWGRHRSELHHIDAFVRQCSIGEMVRWCYDLYEWAENKNVIIKFFMEAGFI